MGRKSENPASPDEGVFAARPIAPGKILARELEARGWTQQALAEIMGRPAQAINEIVRARKRITPETALELSAALGTSAELWLNLESRYRLQLAHETVNRTEIATRAKRHASRLASQRRS